MTTIANEKQEIRHRIREWMTTEYDMAPESQRQMYRDAVQLATSKLTLSELKEMFTILTGCNWS